MQFHRDACAGGPVLDVSREGGRQAEIVQRGRPEFPHQVIDVPIELLGDRLQRFDLLAQVRSIGARALERRDPVAERRQLLAELVVHLSRDTASFVFLCEPQPGEQFPSRAVGALALAHFFSEGLVRLRELSGPFADPAFKLFVRPPQHLLGLLPFGQIEVRADDPDHRSAWRAANRKTSREYVHVSAVLVPQPELRLVGRLAARHAVVRLVGNRPVVRMHQTFPGTDMRFDFILRISEHLYPPSRVHDGVGLDVPVPDAFTRAGECERQALLAFPERLLGSLLFRDVEVRADDAHTRPVTGLRTGKPRERT